MVGTEKNESTKVQNPRRSMCVKSIYYCSRAAYSICTHARKDCAYMHAYNCTLADKNGRLLRGKQKTLYLCKKGTYIDSTDKPLTLFRNLGFLGHLAINTLTLYTNPYFDQFPHLVCHIATYTNLQR